MNLLLRHPRRGLAKPERYLHREGTARLRPERRTWWSVALCPLGLHRWRVSSPVSYGRAPYPRSEWSWRDECEHCPMEQIR